MVLIGTIALGTAMTISHFRDRALDLTQCGPWEGFNNTSFVATDNATGVITGRALYDGRLDLATAIEVARAA